MALEILKILYIFVFYFTCMCVFVCVYEGERERESELKKPFKQFYGTKLLQRIIFDC